jgi:hypothetical protein
LWNLIAQAMTVWDAGSSNMLFPLTGAWLVVQGRSEPPEEPRIDELR